jgi:hypothetical protein
MTVPSSETDYYFRRFGYCPRQVTAPAPRNLGIVVVIPCFDEPDLIGSLESLWLCDRPRCSVEVIVVVNSPAGCSEEIRFRNHTTLKAAAEWSRRRADGRFAFYLLHFADLPPKHAGVGLARKIGMDEALRRFDDVARPEGIIASYDADCRCEPSFLTAIEHHFENHLQSPGCSIYFEHPLNGPESAVVYEAVAAYELHLRYYVQALRYAGLPHAFHTIGSSMAVRAGAFREQGGMNRRKAGEDFHFLHKIIPLGDFTNLTETAVYPSPRPSDRVPFGTGRAVRAFLDGKGVATYAFDAFLALKHLVQCLPLIYQHGDRFAEKVAGGLPDVIGSFLNEQRLTAAVKEIYGNTASESAFRKRFFNWFDGFMAMKFIHHARDFFSSTGKVEEESSRLLARLACQPPAGADHTVQSLLKIYRDLDREGLVFVCDCPPG